MIAAGIEGGSWDAIENGWTLPMYYRMQKHWSENGPPVYLAVAAYLGLTKKKAEKGDLRELASMAKTGKVR